VKSHTSTERRVTTLHRKEEAALATCSCRRALLGLVFRDATSLHTPGAEIRTGQRKGVNLRAPLRHPR
jgi:hypothetical protein